VPRLQPRVRARLIRWTDAESEARARLALIYADREQDDKRRAWLMSRAERFTKGESR
jgi:hypothetical protein